MPAPAFRVDQSCRPLKSGCRRYFIGPDGLRPIWRLLLYLLMYRGAPILSVCFARLRFARSVVPVAADGRGTGTRNHRAGSRTADVADRRPGIRRLWSAVSQRLWQDVLAGRALGIVSLTLLLVALRGAHAFYFGSIALHGVRVLKFAVFWAAFFLIVGFYEEFFTRGYTQFTLTEALGFWPAAILLSLGFGALHLDNPGESWVGILGAMMIGFFFCLTLRRTGNLWFAVGFHDSWDWGESYLYSVPDSGGVAPGHLLHSSLQGPRWLTGGSVGPEGSVFLFVLLMLLWLVFDRVYPEVKYPPLETPPRTT